MRRPKVKSVVVVVILFIFFLFLSFPFENLKGLVFSKIYSLTNILIVADEMSLSFFGWPGVSLRNVNVTLPVGESELELASEKVVFRVGLAGLFPPAPSATMNMRRLKKGGDLYMRFSQGGTLFSVELEASQVNLEQLAFPFLSRPLEGKIGSESSLQVNQSDLSKSTGKISIKADNLKTPSYLVEGPMSFAVPGMKIGKFESVITLKNGVAEFTSIKFGETGSDLGGTITGDIKLGQDLMRSHINVTVRLQLSPQIVQDPQNKTFVTFLEGYQLKPNEYGMRWNASVSELSGLSIKVFPDKLMN